MRLNLKTIAKLAKEVAVSWKDGNAPRLGAALAYYTVFAIAPLFVIVLHVASLLFGSEAAHDQLFGQVQGLLGKEGGKAIEAIVTSAANQPQTGWMATCLATATLVVAATGVFVELQGALNTIWRVKPARGNGMIRFVKDRLLSFAMVVGIGFLLLVSLAVSAGLSGLGQFANSSKDHELWAVVNFSVSLGIIALLFTVILKVLPDVKIAWRDAWVGGWITAVLFNLGKFLLGFYLGRSSFTSVYGAAGSLIIILLWVYYSAQILFFGAEITRVYTNQFGSHLQAVAGARIENDASTKHSRRRRRV